MDLKSFSKALKKSDLFGNPQYGKEFDDIDSCSQNGLPTPKAAVLRTGDIVDNLTFEYDIHVAAHGAMGGSPRTLSLDKDEYFVKAEGTYGKFVNEILIRRITLTTNKGKRISGGYSTQADVPFEYKVDEGYAICALFGRSNRYLNCIGFYLKKIDMDLKSSLLGGMMG